MAISQNINLQTLSPLTIGSGEKLSPLADYWVRDGYVYYLNQDRFEQAMAAVMNEQPNIIGKFTQSVLNVRDIQKNDFLTDFIEHQLRVAPESLSHNLKVPYYSEANAIEMHQILRDGWQPYIAGSTIKGALKTAVIYEWLTKDNLAALEQIARIILEEYRNNERNIANRNRLSEQNPRRLSREDKSRLRQLRRKITRELDRQLNQIINGFLNYQPTKPNFKGKPQASAPHDFHFLQISDTGLFPAEKLEVRQVRRLHLEAEKAEASLQIAHETLATNAQQHFSLKIRPDFQHRHLKWMNEADALKQLFRRVNNFSYDLVVYELNQLDAQAATIAKQKDGRLVHQNFVKFLEARLSELEQTDNSTAYLQLGQGKTFFANSIALAIHNFESNKPYFSNKKHPFDCLLELYELGNPANGLFPVTRTLENMNFIPMGWVQIG